MRLSVTLPALLLLATTTPVWGAPSVPPGGGNRVCCTPNDDGISFDQVCCDDGTVYRCIDADFGWQVDCPTDLSQTLLDNHCSSVAYDPRELFDLEPNTAAALCPYAGPDGPAITFCGVDNPGLGQIGMCSAGATIAEMGIHACTDPARAVCPVPTTSAIGFWLLASLLTATGLALMLRGRRQGTA